MNKHAVSYPLNPFHAFRSGTVPLQTLLIWVAFLVTISGAEFSSRHLLAALYRTIGLIGIAILIHHQLPKLLRSLAQFTGKPLKPIYIFFFMVLVPVIATPLIVAISYSFYPVPGQLPWQAYYEGLAWHMSAFAILGYAHVFWQGNNRLVQGHESINKPNVYKTDFTVESGRKRVFLKTQDITHFRADGDYIKVFTENNAYLIRKKISQLTEELDPGSFQRIHRSYIINLAFVQELSPKTNGDYSVMLKNGTMVKMSRSYNHVIASHIDA